MFSQRILLLLKSTPFTEHSWLWAISGQFGSSPEIRVKILHLAGQSFSWKVFSSLNAQIKIQIVFTFFHINSTSSSLSTLQVSVPWNLPFVANPPEKTCLFASRLAKSSYKCWLLVITISRTVSRSSPHLPFFAASLAMFVTGSEWPMSAWDFTSTVTESGVTWGFDCCQPRQEFWLLPTGKNLYFQQIAFRIATHLTRWAPVLAGMSWRHRCDRQRGTHRTGGQRWHNDLTIKIILTRTHWHGDTLT